MAVKVIGSSVSVPVFTGEPYSVTIPETTPRYTSFLTVTAQTDSSGNNLGRKVLFLPNFVCLVYIYILSINYNTNH